MKRKNYFVVVKRIDEGIEEPRHPMKAWLRNNPDYVPPGSDPNNNTSRELRTALEKNGWRVEEKELEILFYKPDNISATSEEAEAIDTLFINQEISEAKEIKFGLERDLQAALRANIGQLEPGLKIIDKNRERMTEAGRIDIMAEDSDGSIVIIELKAGIAFPDAVTQVLAYIGAVLETENKPVRGILVAGDFPKKTLLAAKAVPNLKLRRYSFQFTFESAV